MKEIKEQIKQLKDVKTIVVLGLLVAVSLCLAEFSIRLTPTLMITFSYLASAICGMFFGPVVGGLFGVITDNVKFFLAPSSGPYCPLFTINEVLAGIIYGVMFCKKEIKLKNVIIAYGSAAIFLNVLLNPLWMHILYNKGYWFYVAERFGTNLILFPVKVFILYFVLKRLEKIRR